MPTPINDVVAFLRRTALGPEDGSLTDGQLLARFIEQRDPAAITALVQRHGPMVWGVSRRILRNHYDAEDAFQATFLVLVRKARSVRQREAVANWLYGVAHQTALKARAMLARRRTRERQGTAMPEPQAAEQDTWNDLQPLLDQELSHLPDKYRIAIVLCDLEGKIRKEAARQLGLPEGTLAGHLTRGRALLAKRLARHGLAVSGGALAAVLSQKAASADVPISLVFSTIKAASMLAAGQAAAPGVISVKVAALTEGVMKSMLLTKLKIPLALVVALAITGTGVAYRFLPAPAEGAAGTLQPLPKREFPAVGGQAATPPKQAPGKPVPVRSQDFLDQALEEFQAAKDEQKELPHRLLADMAGLQAQLGDRDAARKLFEQANDIVAALDDRQQPGEWRMVALAAARAGEVDEAIATAERIPKGDQYRDITFQEVATELAKRRQAKEALRVAAMVESEETRSWLAPMLLEDLALAHAQAGNIPEALRVVERMKDPASRVKALVGRTHLNMTYDYLEHPQDLGVALLQARAGDKARARKTLERAAELIASMPEDKTPRRASALTTLASAQALLGEFATARKTMEQIQNETGKAIALAVLIRQLAQAGRAKEATGEIDRLPAGATQVHALAHLGAGQAKAGDQKAALASFERAHQLIGELPAETDRMTQSHILSTIRADARDYKGALQTVETYIPENTLAYANIAYPQAKAGDFAGALAIVEKIKDRHPRRGLDWWKLNTLRAIAELQAQRGETKAALEWIGGLDSHLARANALMGLAEGTVKTTRPPGKK
jgi:RNA polymerase sigma factor (sigma-70 family)